MNSLRFPKRISLPSRNPLPNPHRISFYKDRHFSNTLSNIPHPPNEPLQNSCDGWVGNLLNTIIMKSKQLADVLIKILGLSMFVHLVAHSTLLIGSIASLIRITRLINQTDLSSSIGYGTSALLQIFLAFLLITKSKSIAGFLFKNEEE